MYVYSVFGPRQLDTQMSPIYSYQMGSIVVGGVCAICWWYSGT